MSNPEPQTLNARLSTADLPDAIPAPGVRITQPLVQGPLTQVTVTGPATVSRNEDAVVIDTTQPVVRTEKKRFVSRAASIGKVTLFIILFFILLFLFWMWWEYGKPFPHFPVFFNQKSAPDLERKKEEKSTSQPATEDPFLKSRIKAFEAMNNLTTEIVRSSMNPTTQSVQPRRFRVEVENRGPKDPAYIFSIFSGDRDFTVNPELVSPPGGRIWIRNAKYPAPIPLRVIEYQRHVEPHRDSAGLPDEHSILVASNAPDGSTHYKWDNKDFVENPNFKSSEVVGDMFPPSSIVDGLQFYGIQGKYDVELLYERHVLKDGKPLIVDGKPLLEIVSAGVGRFAVNLCPMDKYLEQLRKHH